MLKAAALSAALTSLNAQATQIIEGADREHIPVNISAKEQNRLAIEGRRIATVVPSQQGALSFVKDEALGALYFALSSDTPAMSSLTLFVSDDKGVTYKIVLTPRPVAGEEIILRPPGEEAATPASTPAPRTTADGRAVSYQRKIKDLVLVMSQHDQLNLQETADVIGVNKEVPLWKEGRLVLNAKYLDGDLVGEKYHLTNISSSDMLLVEQELFRRGVLAISIEYHTLPPGAGTDIFLVRGRKENE